MTRIPAFTSRAALIMRWARFDDGRVQYHAIQAGKTLAQKSAALFYAKRDAYEAILKAVTPRAFLIHDFNSRRKGPTLIYEMTGEGNGKLRVSGQFGTDADEGFEPIGRGNFRFTDSKHEHPITAHELAFALVHTCRAGEMVHAGSARGRVCR